MALYSIQTQGQLQPYLGMEWLLTNGLGGFASSSIVGCNRRRYHGLLVGATTPPVGRVMALNRVGELVYFDDQDKEPPELSISQFARGFHPRGDRLLERFELDDAARFVYRLEHARIVKEVRLVRGRNAVEIRYQVQSQRPLKLHLLPFVSLRDFHSLLVGTNHAFEVSVEPGRVKVGRDGRALHLAVPGAKWVGTSDWWRGHVYAIETERGQDDTEDLFVPGRFVCKLEGSGEVRLWAGMGEERPSPQPSPGVPGEGAVPGEEWPSPQPSPGVPGEGEGEGEGRRGLSPVVRRLYRAADQFVVRRPRPDAPDAAGTTIIAGYPWFSDWGRDSMIALPGLLLTTRRFAEAAQVLCLFARYVSEGMIPNVFGDYDSRPHYNTADASLWFIHAAHEYAAASGDRATFERELLPACGQILDGYQRGTRYGIGMDGSDGLVRAGDATTQLTWMDAKCDGVVFTPRHGKAVEINALWYHALRLMGQDELAGRVADSFRRAFWWSPYRGLYDVVDGERRDGAIRPNQIYAVSLPHSPLDKGQQRAVVEVVRRELLTGRGLRSLARGETGYRGQYLGPRADRDGAYHNGTVWAYLIGPFLDAYLRVGANSPQAVAQARDWLCPLIDHLEEACIGQISEIFDGDAPHAPRGAFAQAWSVAEVLRLAVRLGL
jgi:glycogen debranching enzyme